MQKSILDASPVTSGQKAQQVARVTCQQCTKEHRTTKHYGKSIPPLNRWDCKNFMGGVVKVTMKTNVWSLSCVLVVMTTPSQCTHSRIFDVRVELQIIKHQIPLQNRCFSVAFCQCVVYTEWRNQQRKTFAMGRATNGHNEQQSIPERKILRKNKEAEDTFFFWGFLNGEKHPDWFWGEFFPVLFEGMRIRNFLDRQLGAGKSFTWCL